MAITNAQQYKQLLAQGGRTGFRGGGQDAGKDSDFKLSGTTARKQNTRPNKPAKNQTFGYDEAGVNQGPGVTAKDREIIGGGLTTQRSRFVDRRNYPKMKLGLFDILTGGKATKKFVDFSSAINRPYFYDKVIKAGRLDPKKFGISYYNLDEYTDDQLEEAYKKYNRARLSNEIDAYGNPIMGGDGMYSDGAVLPKEGILTADAADAIDPIEDKDEIINYRLLADGGRAAFADGSTYDEAGLNEVKSTKQDRMIIGGQGDDEPKGFIKPKGPPMGQGSDKIRNNPNLFGNMRLANNNLFDKKMLEQLGLINDENEDMKVAGLNQEQVDYLNQVGNKVINVSPEGGSLFTYDSPTNIKKQIEKLNPESDSLGFTGFSFDPDKIVEGDKGTYATDQDVKNYMKSNFPKLTTDGRKIGLAEGGMPYEGGIMDLETSRQQYGLGKLVKKITRGVKKIAKSPIGKMALLYAGTAGLGAFGAGAAKAGSGFSIFSPGNVLKNVVSSGKNLGLLKRLTGVGKDGTDLFSRVGPLSNLGIGTGILGISALSGLMTKQDEDDDDELYAGADLPFPVDYYLSGKYTPNRRLAAEGGSMDEPVAKKTMPLLDMDGQEMDLRAEGGFVPLGRMEKADDVPARLSKNEFVFTAEAVRNAGEGDVDKGAEVMYNMMKNLESGGEVSEESQGLEGAREMFQTSQRLEEVI